MSRLPASRLRFHHFWLVIGLSIVCLIIYLSLTTSGVPGLGGLLNDKVSHGLGYFGLMLWFAQIFMVNKIRFFIALAFIAMGVVLEFLQGYGGVRVYEVADMAANTTGVVLGWIAAIMGLDHILARVEQKLLKK